MQHLTRKQSVQIDLVKLLYQQLRSVLWIESAVAICFTYSVWGLIDRSILLTWLFSNLFICGLVRHILLYFYERKTASSGLSSQNVTYWLILFCIGTSLSGIIWGAVGVFFIPALNGAHQLFSIVMIMGAVAAAIPICSPSRISYMTYLFPAYLPFVIWQIMQGDVISMMGVLGVLYIAIMLLISYYTHKTLVSTFNLRYENKELIQDLNKKKGELEKMLSLNQATIQSMKDGVLVVDENNHVRDFNKKFLIMWKIPQEVVDKKNIKKMLKICLEQLMLPSEFLKKFKESTRSQHADTFDEVYFKDGRVFERHSRPQLVGDKLVGRVWSFSDVTEKKSVENKLLVQANYDALTGLPNRFLLMDRIKQGIKHAKRSKTSLAVMFLDLDRFKIINDTLGHTLGDKLLRVVAERLKLCIRQNDTVARSGGDEFIILLTDLRNELDAISIAMKCIKVMSEAFLIETNSFTLTTSIGISFYPKDGDTPDILIRNADIAMYRAKESGRNSFQFFTKEMNEKVQHRMLIENKLHAVKNFDGFKLLYQPIVSLQTNQLSGVEVLIRWNDPDFGEISPSEFIPIAEDCGIIVELGEWVIRSACEQAEKWLNQGLNPVQIHINLSARQFKLANLFDRIQHILNETKVQPHLLALELTEGIIMHDIDKNIDIIKKMKAIGMSIIIDDFGIGYSSLNYLKRLPVDKMKIDRSFMKDVPYSHEDMAIISAIISLAQNLSLKVIAEGVESADQLRFLLKHHCDEIQGFYYSQPLASDLFAKLMRENKKLELPQIR